jgi:hypothetical protein
MANPNRRRPSDRDADMARACVLLEYGEILLRLAKDQARSSDVTESLERPDINQISCIAKCIDALTQINAG